MKNQCDKVLFRRESKNDHVRFSEYGFQWESIEHCVFQDQVLSVDGQDLSVNGQSLLIMQKAVGLTLFSESFNNFKLVSQQFSSNADDVLSVKLNYRGYLMN